MHQPGPVYDNAVKFVAATDVDELCRWLGVPAGPGAVQLSESMPGQTMQADLLLRSDPGHIWQVEFVTHVTTDLARRLVAYRARVMEFHPGDSLQQHVLVLGRGKVAGEVRDAEEFWMRVHVSYLRDRDPEDLLKTPALAPLAVLGRASGTKERRALLRAALRAISTGADPACRPELTDAATTLAAIRLDRATIAAIGKETNVPIDLRDTDLAQSFLQEGREEGWAESMALVLHLRYGQDERIPILAGRLAHLSAERIAEVVTAAASLDALVHALDASPQP